MGANGRRPGLWSVGLLLAWSTTVIAADASVLFVLDGSGSMQAKIGDKRKIEVARTVMSNLVKSLPANVRIGLETYGRNRKDDCKDIEVLAPVGSDHTTVLKAVNALDPKGSTPLTGAIRLASSQLREVEGRASVVIVSDGKETCEGDPCAAVREAIAQGMKLQFHVVGFDVTADEAEQLKCIAKEGKGKYFAATNAEELGTALAQVKEEVVAPPKKEAPPPPSPAKKQTLMEDTFERADLGTDYEVVESDANRLALDSGKLLIVAANPPKNIVLHKKTLAGDFIATVTMNMQLTERNRGGLYYWLDSENYLSIGVHGQCCTDRRFPSFYKRISGQENDIEPDQYKVTTLGSRELKNFATTPEVWYLQLERTGLKYTGRVSVDGAKWMDIGTHTIVQKNGRLGFGASSGGGVENPAEFDDFVVQGTQ